MHGKSKNDNHCTHKGNIKLSPFGLHFLYHNHISEDKILGGFYGNQ